MKVKILLAAIMFLQGYVNVLNAQSNVFVPDVKWASKHNTTCGTNPTNAQDNIYDMIQTSDGGYVGVGFSWIGGDQTGECYDMSNGPCIQYMPRTPYVVKMDASGNVTAEFKYNTSCPGNSGSSSGGVFMGVVESSDAYAITGEGYGGLFTVKIAKDLSGVSTFGISPGYGAYCMKRVWKVTYPDGNNPTVGVLAPDGYIVAGIAYTGNNQYHDTYIMRLNEDMTWAWDKTIHLDQWSRAFSIAPLYRFGTKINGEPNPDPNGTNPHDYGSITNDIVTGFAIAGEYGSSALAIKLSNNSAKDIVWEDVIQSSGRYFGASNGQSINLYNRLSQKSINCYDQTYDANGDLLSDIYTNFPGGNKDVGKCIIQTTQGFIVMAAEFHVFALSCNLNQCYSTEYKDAETVLLRWGPFFPNQNQEEITTAQEVAHSSGPDFEEKVKETADGGFIVASTTADIGYQTFNSVPFPTTPPPPDPDILADRSDESEMILYKVDQDFQPQWTVPIPSNYYFQSPQAGLYSFDFTSDGGYIIAGFNTNNNEDIAAAKLLNCQGTVTGNFYTFPTSNFRDPDIIKDANETNTTSPYYDANYRHLVDQGLPSIVRGTWVVSSKVTLRNYTLYFMDTRATTYPQSRNSAASTLIFISGQDHSSGQGNLLDGHLILENCTLRGLDRQGMTGECADDPDNLKDMWDGIVVEGDFWASQSNNPERFGWLELIGTTIREARVGVSLGPVPDASNAGQGGAYLKGGGILQTSMNGTQPSQFINCRNGAIFYPYSDIFTPLSGINYTNQSHFDQTIFDCTGPLKGYNGQDLC